MASYHSLNDLHAFIADVLTALGVPAGDADTTARRMLEADVRGMAAHGIFRLPQYVKRIEAGGYNLHPDIRAVRETPVSALIDGDNGLGQVVVTQATERAIAKAREHGLGWVGVRGSNHAGAAGVYASMGLEYDLIGVYLAVGSSNHLPAWGGLDPLLSTNPLAVAIPAGAEPPVVLDMATTVVSYGRIKLAAERGEKLPEGWMVDRRGEPLTDPRRSSEGFLLPIGGYKGYGLGVVIGMLAGVLNGAAFGSEVVDFTTDHRTPTNTGQSVFMMRPDLFRPLAEFQASMDERIRELRASTPMPGHPPVRLPGDQVPARAERARRDGIELSAATLAQLRELGDRLGVRVPPSFQNG
jgi:LDH2 family malate/lactate/ureidoglycolate dehydrogenase